MKTWQKYLVQIAVGAVVLGAIVAFGYTGHLSSSQTYDGIMAFIGVVGASGLLILASTVDNQNAIPHLALGLLLVVGVVILGLHSIFDSAQISAFILLILGPSAIATGAASVGAVLTSGVVPPAPVQAPAPAPAPATPAAVPSAVVPGTTQSAL